MCAENVLNGTEGIYRNHLFRENVLDGTKCVAKGILCNLKRLFGTNDHGTSKAHRGRGDVLMRLAQEDSLVRKNARFAHDMVNSGSDVRGRRFSAHAIRVNRDFTLSRNHLYHWLNFIRACSCRAKMKTAPRKFRSAFLGVGAEGVEPPTLCL